MHWKNHISQMTPTLYTSLCRICNSNTARKIYFTNFYSKMKYVIIWGRNSSRNTKHIYYTAKHLYNCGLQRPTSIISMQTSVNDTRDFPCPIWSQIFINELHLRKQHMLQKLSAVPNIDTRKNCHIYRTIFKRSCPQEWTHTVLASEFLTLCQEYLQVSWMKRLILKPH